MRWWFWVVPCLLVLLAACGGGSSPGASSSPPAAALAACTGPLPGGKVGFRGRVLSLEEPTPTVAGAIKGLLIEVSATDIDVTSLAVNFGNTWFQPGGELWVSLPGGGWPDLRPGDCVVGSGAVAWFSCSDGTNGQCDAVRFEADSLERAEPGSGSPEAAACPAPDTAQASPQGQVVFSGPVIGFDKMQFAEAGFPAEGWSFTIDSSSAVFTNVDSGGYESTQSPIELKLISDSPFFLSAGDISAGDCIHGSAHFRRYACGQACDAAGLLVDEIRLRLS